MKLWYVTNSRIPTEKAHGVQIMKMCEAFALNGAKVTLVVPARRGTKSKDPFAYYDVQNVFNIVRLPVIDFVGWHVPFAFFIETISFAASCTLWLIFKKSEGIIYARGEMSLFLTRLIPRKKFPFFWETHIKPIHIKRYAKVFSKSVGIVVVTKYYQKELLTFGVDEKRLLFIPDGVDYDAFNISISREDAREKLNLPIDKRIVVYTGSDVVWKGLSILRDATVHLPSDVLTIFVGDIKRQHEDEGKVLFVGHKPSSEMVYWLKAADVLVLTGDYSSDTACFYTSPLKLFEYMASDRTIVATDIPSFRDILNERNAYLTSAKNGEMFARALMDILDDSRKGNILATQALKDVAQYDWKTRTKNILEFISTRI